MSYKIILIDIDDTLLDFQKSEEISIKKTIEQHGLIAPEELIQLYNLANTLQLNAW